MNTKVKEFEKYLGMVQKPARYIGGEVGEIVKEYRQGMLRFCLCFPEIYEVGICHTGGHILYKAVNDSQNLICERAYCPAEDLAGVLRKHEIPLFSLETKTALGDFDVIGFSLEYELSLTNVLEMLDLAGIPIRASERGEGVPFIIAGGPCAFQPEPAAPFFDLFVIGDGEEVLVQILEVIRKNELTRNQMLRELSKIEGVYVPSFYGVIFDERGFAGFKINEGAPFPIRSVQVSSIQNSEPQAIVPWVEAIHDRLSVEVMRGCGRRCRFCSAGWVYLPIREKPSDSVFSETIAQIDRTGWEEIGLLSLSTMDYSEIGHLLSRLGPVADKKNFSISVPSIRPEQLDSSALSVLSKVRKSSMTFAPEAGTERLRKVINKTIDIEGLFKVIEKIFSSGWKTVKLYFMIGLPTETDEDVLAIADLCARADDIARRYHSKVNVSISPFIPKPHTPFAWEPQISPDEIARRLRLVKSSLSRRNIKITGRIAELSEIETALSRGDRRVADVVEATWRIGGGFAAWSENIDIGIWLQAFEQAGFSIADFCDAVPLDRNAPWEIVSKGTPRAFLLKERERAYAEEYSESCRERGGCDNCGICGFSSQIDLSSNNNLQFNNSVFGRKLRKYAIPPINSTLFRVKFAKNGYLRYLGHLDTIRAIIRAIRRVGLEVAYSEGHHRHPKIAFGPPLPTGFKSSAEYFDMELQVSASLQSVDILRTVFPKGMDFIDCQYIFKKGSSLFDAIGLALYRVVMPDSYNFDLDRLESVLLSDTIPFTRRDKAIDIKRYYNIHHIYRYYDAINILFLLNCNPNGAGRPQEYLIAAGMNPEVASSLDITREELLIEHRGEFFDPFGKSLSQWVDIINKYDK